MQTKKSIWYRLTALFAVITLMFGVPAYAADTANTTNMANTPNYAQRMTQTITQVEYNRDLRILERALRTQNNDAAVRAAIETVLADIDAFSTMQVVTQNVYNRDVNNTVAVTQTQQAADAYTQAVTDFYTVLKVGANTPYAATIDAILGADASESLRYFDASMLDTESSDVEKNLLYQYDQLAAQNTTVTIDGKTWTWETLTEKQNELSDKQIANIYRQLAQTANQPKAEVYAQLVENRTKQAKAAGYDNVLAQMNETVYLRDFNAEDIEAYCAYVAEEIVPIYTEWKAVLQQEDAQTQLEALAGRSTAETMDFAKSLLSQIDWKLVQNYEYMRSHGLYDISDPLPGRTTGAYTIGMSQYQDAFLFQTKVGGYWDLRTLLHEFGHFSAELENTNPALLSTSILDVAEIHSQALELLTAQQANQVFSADLAEAYRAAAAVDILESVVMGALVYSFEDAVYQTQPKTVTEYNQLFAKVQDDFGVEMYPSFETENGKECFDWVNIEHIFHTPGYYLSYSTSAFAALDIWMYAQQDWQGGVDLYMQAVEDYVDIPYQEFLQYLELDSPFTTAGRENLVSGLEAVTLYDATQQASTQTTQTTQTNTAYDESMTYDMLRQQDIQIPQEIDTVLPAA